MMRYSFLYLTQNASTAEIHNTTALYKAVTSSNISNIDEEYASLWETTVMPILFTFEVLVTFYIVFVLLLEEVGTWECNIRDKNTQRRSDPHRIFR